MLMIADQLTFSITISNRALEASATIFVHGYHNLNHVAMWQLQRGNVDDLVWAQNLQLNALLGLPMQEEDWLRILRDFTLEKVTVY